MKENELRIGNWVTFMSKEMDVLGVTKHNGTNETVRHYVEFKGLVPIKLIHIKPIPLTEEWLLKFGFVKDKLTNYDWYKGDFEICLPSYFKYKESHIHNIKHVHQLQNLYHALTGKEL